ncbi:hypothetical protein GPALN_014496 [Globodera pallida]|nr:hypothetical protein GPALN_014496 [Globodera pallida]
MNAILILNYPNSTTDRSFFIYEAGDTPNVNYMSCIDAVFSVIFMVICVLLNIGTFVAYKQHLKKIAINGNNEYLIEKRLLIYALATFLGHALVASIFLINIITNTGDTKTVQFLYIYYLLHMDIGTVVLSSWLLLWASSTIRQQLINDFTIFCKTNIQNNRVDALEGPRNNNHRAVGGAVGHQLQNRFCSSINRPQMSVRKSARTATWRGKKLWPVNAADQQRSPVVDAFDPNDAVCIEDSQACFYDLVWQDLAYIHSNFGRLRLDVMTLTLTPMTPMTPFLSGVMTYDADGVTGILLTLTLTPMTPMTPFLSGVMTHDADAVTGLSKKMTLTRDADSGTGDVQP